MDVAVRLPFRIDLDILEVEDRFPSLQFAVAVDRRSSSTLSFYDEIWIEHARWSVFVDIDDDTFGHIQSAFAECPIR